MTNFSTRNFYINDYLSSGRHISLREAKLKICRIVRETFVNCARRRLYATELLLRELLGSIERSENAFLIVFATSRRCCPLERSIYTRICRPTPPERLGIITTDTVTLPPRRPRSCTCLSRKASGEPHGGNDTLTLICTLRRGGARRTNRNRDPLSYLVRHSNLVSFLFLIPHLKSGLSLPRYHPPPSQHHSISSLSVNLHLGR